MADVVELGYREPEVGPVAGPAGPAGVEVRVVKRALALGVATAELEDHHRDLAGGVARAGVVEVDHERPAVAAA